MKSERSRLLPDLVLPGGLSVPSLLGGVRSSLRVRQARSFAEVGEGLAVVRSSEEKSVAAEGIGSDQLVESEDTASRLENPLSGTRRELEGADLHLGDLQQTLIVGDRADDHDRLLSTRQSLLYPAALALRAIPESDIGGRCTRDSIRRRSTAL